MAKKTTAKQAIGVGVGLAAAAAAVGAGYYLFGSKKAAAHRAKTVKWANDLKKDVVRAMKKAKKLDEQAYRAIVDEATKAYHTLGKIDRSDLEQAAAELRDNFKAVKREVSRVATKNTKVVTNAAKTAARKVVKAAKASAKPITKKVAKTAKKATGKKK